MPLQHPIENSPGTHPQARDRSRAEVSPAESEDNLSPPLCSSKRRAVLSKEDLPLGYLLLRRTRFRPSSHLMPPLPLRQRLCSSDCVVKLNVFRISWNILY